MKSKLQQIAQKQIDNIRVVRRIGSNNKTTATNNDAFVTDKRVDRMFHNLSSIYAHCTQLTDSILPITGRGSASAAIRQLESFLSSHPADAALLIFKLNKQIMSLGSELTAYRLLNETRIDLEPMDIGLYSMVRNVASGFFAELNENSNYIDIDNSYVKAHFDFQTIEVALYYLIENAVKYVLPKSKIGVAFESTMEWEIVRFHMTSLYIDVNEVDKIFEEGYSGVESQRGNLCGKGLGMTQAKILIELNGGNLTITAGKIKKSRRNNLRYADNTVIIKLPKAVDDD